MKRFHLATVLVGVSLVTLGCEGTIFPVGGVNSGSGGSSLPGTGGPSPGPGVDGAGSGGTTTDDGGTPAGTGGTVAPGTGGTGAPGTGGVGAGGSVAPATGIPCDVQTLLGNRCASCHGPTPLPSLPSLVTYEELTALSKSDPTKTYAVVALARMQSAQSPMPPVGAAPATATEIAALQAWIDAGYPMGSCGGSADGGTTADGGPGDGATAPDPFGASPTCTSNKSWSGGNNGSDKMNPGMACINCHTTSGGEGPNFALAGTLYPTAHEPDLCNGSNGAAGAQIVVTGADGIAVTMTPNAVGNFSYRGTVAKPYTAKVTERIMVTAQTSGDCNSCHTQTGVNSAPGRIITP